MTEHRTITVEFRTEFELKSVNERLKLAKAMFAIAKYARQSTRQDFEVVGATLYDVGNHLLGVNRYGSGVIAFSWSDLKGVVNYNGRAVVGDNYLFEFFTANNVAMIDLSKFRQFPNLLVQVLLDGKIVKDVIPDMLAVGCAMIVPYGHVAKQIDEYLFALSLQAPFDLVKNSDQRKRLLRDLGQVEKKMSNADAPVLVARVFDKFFEETNGEREQDGDE